VNVTRCVQRTPTKFQILASKAFGRRRDGLAKIYNRRESTRAKALVLRTKQVLAFLSGIGVALLYAAVQASDIRILSTDLLLLLISCVCTFSAMRVLKRWGVWSKYGKLYLGGSLGIALTALGNAVEIGSVLVGIDYGYPSPVDILDVTGGLLIVLGLFPFLYSLRRNLTRERIVIFSVCALLVIGSVGLYMLRSGTWSAKLAFADLVSLAFPVLGVVGFTLAFLLFLVLKETPMAESWFAIALGALFFSAGNIAYGIATMRGWYYVGNPLEILWNWGYVALAFGFEAEKKEFDEYHR